MLLLFTLWDASDPVPLFINYGGIGLLGDLDSSSTSCSETAELKEGVRPYIFGSRVFSFLSELDPFDIYKNNLSLKWFLVKS